jgi:hypothetical protein
LVQAGVFFVNIFLCSSPPCFKTVCQILGNKRWSYFIRFSNSELLDASCKSFLWWMHVEYM